MPETNEAATQTLEETLNEFDIEKLSFTLSRGSSTDAYLWTAYLRRSDGTQCFVDLDDLETAVTTIASRLRKGKLRWREATQRG